MWNYIIGRRVEEAVKRQLVRLSGRQLDRPSCVGASIHRFASGRLRDGQSVCGCFPGFLSVN